MVSVFYEFGKEKGTWMRLSTKSTVSSTYFLQILSVLVLKLVQVWVLFLCHLKSFENWFDFVCYSEYTIDWLAVLTLFTTVKFADFTSMFIWLCVYSCSEVGSTSLSVRSWLISHRAKLQNYFIFLHYFLKLEFLICCRSMIESGQN